jgi:type I restriction enzyme R subunit
MAQSEQQLENKLITQLTGLGYERAVIPDAEALFANLKTQLEHHNNRTLTDAEFTRVRTAIRAGNVFDRAKILRDKIQYVDETGEVAYLQLFNKEQWCQNQYQVTNQISLQAARKNRYDVTLLINGLPLVHIELKKRGVELKQAFKQINRYHKDTFARAADGLFQFVQIFVISNGVNTRYYANNKTKTYKFTSTWSTTDNIQINELAAFADAFLEKCHVSKMIAKYTVLHKTEKALMVLRPYQYYAAEAIQRRARESDGNGYIWHTTGSGKTLTSFKAAQLLLDLDEVHKVVFVVDRNDLDYQTTTEFNYYQKGSVDGTENTKELVAHLNDPNKDFIVTTIQKLNNAVLRPRYLSRVEDLRDQKIIFIFDECHRSQFGVTHQRITDHFNNAQLFGFTGTPILEENASRNELGKRTTLDLFDRRLHTYVITDAIRDANVLRFSVEYVGRYREREGSRNNVDIEVQGINRRELLESDDRVSKIVDYVLAYHNLKTSHRQYTSIFAVASVPLLIKYYEELRRRFDAGEHDLRVATIFTWQANADSADADGYGYAPDVDEDDESTLPTPDHRDKLEEFLTHYNEQFGVKQSIADGKAFDAYRKDIAKRIKGREYKTAKESDRIDILLVVNMFLTGFDAKAVNTLYVDKNLKHHGLIQAYSRTNRIFTEDKSQGNIVSFRNLKPATDDAVRLFSGRNASEQIFLAPYDEYAEDFRQALETLRAITPSPASVDDLPDEEADLAFVVAFRALVRLLNVLQSFSDFSWLDLGITEQEYNDYRSKYLDLKDEVRSRADQTAVVSILDEVDFEVELIRRDRINVRYILNLLAELSTARGADRERRRRQIISLLTGEVQLRSKREFIEEFIENHLPPSGNASEIEAAFAEFWDERKQAHLHRISIADGIPVPALRELIDEYFYSGRQPSQEELIAQLETPPSILQRVTIAERLLAKIMEVIEIFEDGVE